MNCKDRHTLVAPPNPQYHPQLMSSHRRQRPSLKTQTKEHVRTFKHSADYSEWSVLGGHPGDKGYRVIKDRVSGQLCLERPSAKRRSGDGKLQVPSDTHGGTLTSIPERTQVSPPTSTRTRREQSTCGSRVLEHLTTADHAPPAPTGNPLSHRPSSTRSIRVPAIVKEPQEEPKDEADIGIEGEEKGGDEDDVEVIDVVKEGEGGDGSGTLVEETEVAPVSVAGEG